MKQIGFYGPGDKGTSISIVKDRYCDFPQYLYCSAAFVVCKAPPQHFFQGDFSLVFLTDSSFLRDKSGLGSSGCGLTSGFGASGVVGGVVGVDSIGSIGAPIVGSTGGAGFAAGGGAHPTTIKHSSDRINTILFIQLSSLCNRDKCGHDCTANINKSQYAPIFKSLSVNDRFRLSFLPRTKFTISSVAIATAIKIKLRAKG